MATNSNNKIIITKLESRSSRSPLASSKPSTGIHSVLLALSTGTALPTTLQAVSAADPPRLADQHSCSPADPWLMNG